MEAAVEKIFQEFETNLQSSLTKIFKNPELSDFERLRAENELLKKSQEMLQNQLKVLTGARTLIRNIYLPTLSKESSNSGMYIT